jgi:YcxB-like protein
MWRIEAHRAMCRLRGAAGRSRAGAGRKEQRERMIEIEGRLTPADLTAAIWARASRWPALWALLLVTVGVAVAASADGAPWYYAVGLVGSMVGVLLWSLLAGPLRRLRSGPFARSTSRWTVSDTELRSENVAEDGGRLSEGAIPWSALRRVAETRTAFLLFGSGRGAMPLPKRWFASDADVAAFRALADGHGLIGRREGSRA